MNNNNHNNNNHNFGINGTNTSYSNRQQLSDNNLNVNNSSRILQNSIVDYYDQEPFHGVSSRQVSHYSNDLYQDNNNHFYRYNMLSSTSINQSR